MTGNPTREERLADQITQLREKYTLDESYWTGMRERCQMQWQLDDLRSGIADLVGRYRFHADHEGNVRLGELVERLSDLTLETFR